MGANKEWNRLSWDEKRHRSLSLTDCPPWGPGKVWRGLVLCKNLQTQSIPLECGPDCWNHLESPWIAPRVEFMGRALHPGYHTRANPVLIPTCFDRGQVLLCLQPSRTPHLRRLLWEETDFHLSLLSLTIFLSDPQHLLSSLSPQAFEHAAYPQSHSDVRVCPGTDGMETENRQILVFYRHSL